MEKRRIPLAFRSVFLVVLIGALQFACTKKEETGTVRIVMPGMPATSSSSLAKVSAASAVVSSSTVAASGEGTSFNSAINPTSASEINCFAVFIGGGDLNANYCMVGSSATDASTIRFGPNIGFIKSGEPISFDIPVGPRMIYVLGLRSTNATTTACSANYSGDDHSNLSEPFLIASQPVNIISGANNVAVKAALDTSKKAIDCKFMSNGSGTSGGKLFGDKRDGSITPTVTPPPLQSGTSTLSSGTVRSGTSTLADTKVFGASRRITGIATSGADAGRAIQVQASFGASEFEVGDEIAWLVAGGNSGVAAIGPDDSISGACGGGLYTGRFGTSRIKSTPSINEIVLEQPISGSPSTIRTANLSVPPTAGGAFCTLIMTRISSFDTIAIPDSTTFYIKPQALSYGDGIGGLLVIRAETISVGSGAALYIDGSGKGYAGGTITGGRFQGDGLSGIGGSTLNTNYNGGAPGDTGTSSGAGGGGHAGAGGAGTNAIASTGLGGSPLNHCLGGMPCTPLSDQKVFMGGGGGFGADTGLGGQGGGVVIVFARKIIGSGSVTISANGAAAGGTGAVGSGGGAGGAAALYNQDSAVSNLTIGANGGTGSMGTGGGGSGGVVNVVGCLAKITSSFTHQADGGTGGGAGMTGLKKIVNDEAVCSAP
jgi:hypothetical protein